MAIRNPFLYKIAYIKNNYGQAAYDYFVSHTACESCGEERLACLTIHHLYGKNIEKFKTLCANCHAVVHATRLKSMTHKDHLKIVEIKQEEKHRRDERNQKIIKMIDKGLSLREVAKKTGVSHVTVYEVSRKFNIRSKHKNQHG